MRTRRAFIIGFVVGAIVLVLAAFVSVLVETPAWLFGVLTVGAVVLRPFAEAMAGWPGLLNIALAAAANGLVYGVVAIVVAWILNVVRR